MMQQAKLVITADGGFRKGKAHALKEAVDQALLDNSCPSIEHVLVVQRTKTDVAMSAKDVWWHDALAKANS